MVHVLWGFLAYRDICSRSILLNLGKRLPKIFERQVVVERFLVVIFARSENKRTSNLALLKES